MARAKEYIVRLSDEEVIKLRTIIKKKETCETIGNRCRILLAVDEAHQPVLKYRECVAAYGVSMATVSNTVLKYNKSGLEALLVFNRNVNSDNARRKVDGRTEARIIEIACGPVPVGHSRWTLRLLEEQMRIILDEPISREAIRRTLKKMNFNLTVKTIGAYQQ